MSALRALLSRQFLVFVGVGVACALVDVGLLWGLSRSGTPTAAAASIGFFAGLLLNFVLHLRITFSARWSSRAVWRYAVVVTINYGITLLLVEISDSVLADPVPGKLLSLPIIAVNGFFLSKHWVFK